MERGSTVEETRRRGARRELGRSFTLVIGRIVGVLGLLCALLSVGGQFLLHPSSLPLKDNVVFSPWMSRLGELVGTNASMRRCCSGRRGQASKCRCSPSFSAPCSSLWVVGVFRLDFRGMALMGRISARREKRQFEVQRMSSGDLSL